MEPCLKLPLEENVLADIEAKVKDWAAVHGIVLRTSEADPVYKLELAPFTLLPSPFPNREFQKARRIQQSLNQLIHKAAHDPEFLHAALKNTTIVDEFTARLYRVYEAVVQAGIRQEFSLGLLRCDYLLDTSKTDDSLGIIKQVEMNTISTSFASLATELSELHRYALQELGHAELSENVPVNSPVHGFAQGLVAAWKAYNSPRAAIVFLVEPFVRMVGDQKLLEYAIRKQNSSIPILRRTLRDFAERATITDHILYIDGYEAAVIYYRDCYTEHQYPLEIDWETRLMIEMSRAIKCPSIQYQLAGTKKVQQELSRPEILKKFIQDPQIEADIQEVFTGLYSLDEGEEGNAAITLAVESPYKFVLKPQREGGGNNLYGEDVREVLLACRNSHERSAYILMDRIVPPATKNYLLRPNHKAQFSDVVSELGIYGVVLGTATDIVMNEEVGHLLRTKPSSSDEGGVVAGFAALDGMFLV